MAEETKDLEAKVADKVRRHQEITGVVVTDKMSKTRVIEIKRTIRHSLYHKNLVRRRRLMVHDEKNESKVGDVILASSSRPLSRHKHFSLVKIVEKRIAE